MARATGRTPCQGTPCDGISPARSPPLGTSYRRCLPELSDLYRVVQENYRSCVSLHEEGDRPLPWSVQREFEGYLRCGILAEGFARVHCQGCGFDRLVAFSCKGRGWCPSCGGRA